MICTSTNRVVIFMCVLAEEQMQDAAAEANINVDVEELMVRFRLSGIEYRVSGIGYQVSGIRFRVSGFGYRVSGIGSRILGTGHPSPWVWQIRYRGQPIESR